MSKQEWINKEASYHLRMATKCKKYAMSVPASRKDWYLNKGREHLNEIKKLGLRGLGIEI